METEFLATHQKCPFSSQFCIIDYIRRDFYARSCQRSVRKEGLYPASVCVLSPSRLCELLKTRLEECRVVSSEQHGDVCRLEQCR